MAVHIQLRRGSAAEWVTADPILTEGEMGLELDTGKIKIGNGVLVWTLLPYGIDPTFAIVGELGAVGGAGGTCIVTMPCAGTIFQSDIDGDVSGSAVVNVYKAPLATPTVYTSIVAAAKPTLASAQSATNSTLAGWTTGFAKGDRIKFVCEAIVTIALVAVTLRAVRS